MADVDGHLMVASIKAKIAPRKRKQMDFALALHRRIDTNTKELSKAHRFTAMQTICADGDAAGTRFKPALLQAKAPTAPHNNTTTHGLDNLGQEMTLLPIQSSYALVRPYLDYRLGGLISIDHLDRPKMYSVLTRQ